MASVKNQNPHIPILSPTRRPFLAPLLRCSKGNTYVQHYPIYGLLQDFFHDRCDLLALNKHIPLITTTKSRKEFRTAFNLSISWSRSCSAASRSCAAERKVVQTTAQTSFETLFDACFRQLSDVHDNFSRLTSKCIESPSTQFV